MQQLNKDEHIIRVKSDKPAHAFITQAAFKFLRDQIKNPREGESTSPLDYVIFSASGKAIHTALIAADVIKRKIPGLHQVTRIYTTQPNGQFGEDEQSEIQNERGPKLLSVLDIVLTKKPTEDMKKEPGYIAATQITNEQKDFTLDEIVQRKRPVPYRNNHRNYGQRQHYNNYNQYQQEQDGEYQTRPYRGPQQQRKSSYNSNQGARRQNQNRQNRPRENYKRGGQRTFNNANNQNF
ncbi:hypothetical protein PPERSA_03711 [Pseudocohnilembus persalinus]|uniref:DNA/RNA-binding protein Alba-like domain-containing protein n=1 Tax=Pseudocohnilembus persalinus TaxID=266149 RepID=A0A0V0QG82_PSEPJ|nr:hypothetical protein PPERSA_03711 [Pseudocohnilembus persalinus]|eukprot:KRX01207.1 hypothetical protein PPERSA_03711 [Pseudocohnilembus persalinus]